MNTAFTRFSEIFSLIYKCNKKGKIEIRRREILLTLKLRNMLNQEVRKIMTKDPVVVSPTNTVWELSQIMINNDVQQVPVVENGQLVGMITTHDLWKNASSGGQSDQMEVGKLMSKNIIKIMPKDKVGTAAELFMDKRFKTLPVVNLKNELKGVVTAFDVIKHTMKKEYKTPILYKEVLTA